MSRTESYAGKTFIVADADTRLRNPDNLMEFERYKAVDPLPAGEQVGNIKRIPKGTELKVDKIKIVPTGSSGSIVFAHVLSRDGTTDLGWTSTRNFSGEFINETIGATPPAPGASRFGPNAAWKEGKYQRQLTLVAIVDANRQVKHIALDTLDPFLDLVQAAANDDVLVAINSGFRSYPEQKYLYEGYINHRPGFNTAARPGNSNHQSGIAFDIAVAGGAGSPVYDWLKRSGPSRGFVRTVNKEPWHWEFDQAKAAVAVATHTYKTSNVKV
jgi:D-alanyl-D-alanine carboxypeptidase